MPEFVSIGGRRYEVVIVANLSRRGRQRPWVACHRTHRVYINRGLDPADRSAALAYAVASGRRLTARAG